MADFPPHTSHSIANLVHLGCKVGNTLLVPYVFVICVVGLAVRKKTVP